MMDWQPIETAPRDGTKIDLWSLDTFEGPGRVTDCWWGIQAGGGFGYFRGETEKQWVNVETDVAGEFMDVAVYSVTHWMPRPQPPA